MELKIGTNQRRLLGGFLKLNDAESVNFHRVPNQVLYQAEPLPDKGQDTGHNQSGVATSGTISIASCGRLFFRASRDICERRSCARAAAKKTDTIFVNAPICLIKTFICWLSLRKGW